MEKYTRREIIYIYLTKINPNEKVSLTVLVKLAIKTGNRYEFEHQILCKDGSIKYILGIGKRLMQTEKLISTKAQPKTLPKVESSQKELNQQNVKT
jgi:hypothetical protein